MSEIFIPTARVVPDQENPKFATVWTDWACTDKSVQLDRPLGTGIAVRKKDVKRVVAAINSGKAHSTPRTLLTDVNGKTYVGCTFKLSGRHLNWCLQQLGF